MSATRRRKRAIARDTLEAKLAHAWHTVELLEQALCQEREWWVDGLDLALEVKLRMQAILPVVKADVEREAVDQGQRVLRNLAVHEHRIPMGDLVGKGLPELNRIQRAGRWRKLPGSAVTRAASLEGAVEYVRGSMVRVPRG